MFSFLAILLICMDWAITGRIARVQFNSTLERKVKTRALKGIFLVRKWINNILKSNSVRYHKHHWKNLSFLSSFGLRAVFVKGPKIAVFVSIVKSKRARWPPLFVTVLTRYISVPSFIYNPCYVLLLRNHLKYFFGMKCPVVWWILKIPFYSRANFTGDHTDRSHFWGPVHSKIEEFRHTNRRCIKGCIILYIVRIFSFSELVEPHINPFKVRSEL